MNSKPLPIRLLYEETMRSECLQQVVEFAHHHNMPITRTALIQALRNPKHREAIVSGSMFDLVQQKLNQEQELEHGLIQAKKKGLSWREAVYELHIGPNPDYARLKAWYEHSS